MSGPLENNFTAGDGRAFWIVGLEGERHWPVLARVVGRPEWVEDERYADPASRRQHRPELVAELDAIFATRPLAEWAEEFAREPDVFWAPVNTIGDLPTDEQFLAAGGLVEVPDETGGRLMLSTPADFGGRPPPPRWRAPKLGEHTREVLGELGLDEAEVAGLLEEGVALAEGGVSGSEA